MRLLPTFLLLGACFLVYSPVFSTSIIPFHDLAETTANSECVVMAKAEGHESNQWGSSLFRDTRLVVTEQIKGVLGVGQPFLLRPMSFKDGDFDVDISGDFEPTIGKTYLLFMSRSGDVWKPMMLSYYVFEQFFVGTDEYLVPISGEGIEALSMGGGITWEPLAVYRQDALLQNLSQHHLLPSTPWDGSIGRSPMRAEDFIALDRTAPTGCDFMLGSSTYLCRWSNPTIPIFHDDTNVPADWTTDFAAVLSAFNSNYTGISPSDAGPVSYTPSCSGGAQGGNFTSFCNNNLGGTQCTLVIFDDPCNQIANLTNCGGVLAVGGSYALSSTHTFDGQTWNDAAWGFVIVNNGVPACWPGVSYQRMLTHELTHMYRMDHLDATSYPGQNMNPSCCNAINIKDKECMNYAYVSSMPVELVSFDAQVSGTQTVQLKWVTQAERDNAHFTVERSSDGVNFEKIKEVAGRNAITGGTYEWVDQHPISGVNYYMLSQTDRDGTMQHLSIKTVRLTASEPALFIAPNPVAGDVLHYRVDLPDNFDGAIEAFDVAGKVLFFSELSLEKGSYSFDKAIEQLSPGIYSLRLSGAQQQWTQRFVKK